MGMAESNVKAADDSDTSGNTSELPVGRHTPESTASSSDDTQEEDNKVDIVESSVVDNKNNESIKDGLDEDQNDSAMTTPTEKNDPPEHENSSSSTASGPMNKQQDNNKVHIVDSSSTVDSLKEADNEVQITCKDHTNNDQLLSFLDQFELKSFYPEKISVTDVIQIRKKSTQTHYSDIPWIVLQNLMMINSTSRDKMVEDLLAQLHDEDKQCEGGVFGPNADIWAELGLRESEQTNLNPIDLISAIFMCSSPSLRNLLASKCLMCKLAVPFIVPIEKTLKIFYIFLHSLVIETKGDDDRMIQTTCADVPCHYVSFIRLGKISVSKSTLLNSLLSDTCHSTFFNRDCSLGKTQQEISNGLIEAAWFIPSKKPDINENLTMFLNLRGNAESMTDQVHLLTSMSTVAVIFTTLNNLKNETFNQICGTIQANVACGIILVIDGINNDETTIKSTFKEWYEQNQQYKSRTKFCLVAKDQNYESVAKVRKIMKKNIFDFLKDAVPEPISSKLTVSLLNEAHAYTDENENPNILAKLTVEKLMNFLKHEDVDVKERIAPLQGQTWQAWSDGLKIINKPSKFASLEERAKYEEDMKEQRTKQLDLYRHIHPFMNECIDSISKNLLDENEFILLVEWMKLQLEERSRNLSSKCSKVYHSDLERLTTAKQENKDQEIIASLHKKLDKSKRDFANANFRFDHIMREFGQIYETLSANKANLKENEGKLLVSLPHIGAKLLLIGYPIEIMDGDVSNVPLTWVKAVLTKLKELVGDKKILAISVVGIQSSGKSTLLNTMFGLQFAVSAGRCTRGVFMQLIPVEEECFQFDYLLVIDTEGLRAPEQMANQSLIQDNKLATFIIGLGDIIIVNIKGENTSEVKDILQTSVHAFLRLKLVNKRLNLEPSCIFVHQNVPAADAGDKMKEERQIFVETLDEMTRNAAEQENIADVTAFYQVIDLESEEDIVYFSDLWQGDPPMAPVNPGYSNRVAAVKETIIFRLSRKRETYLTISDTIVRIEDLWNGILKDDFVYSFRNTLELKAYSQIEREYHAYVWELDKIAREFRVSKAKVELLKCKQEDDLEKAVGQIVNLLAHELTEKVDKLSENLSNFIERNPLKATMIQWKQTKLNRLTREADEIVYKSQTDINNLKEEIRVEKLHRTESKKHEIEINKLAQTLAYELKGQTPTDEFLMEKFDYMWITWMNRFDVKNVEDSDIVKNEIREELQTKFRSDLAYMEEHNTRTEQYDEMTQLTNSITTEDIKDDDISLKVMVMTSGPVDESNLKSKYKSQTVDIANKIFQTIDLKLDELYKQDVKFDITYAKEILHLIETFIDDHNTDTSGKSHFSLTSSYRAMIISHVASYITVIFTRMNEKYNKQHSPIEQIKAYKKTAWTLFKNLVEKQAEDVISLGFFTEATVSAVTDHVLTLIPLDVEEKIYHFFKQEKYQVMKAIMIDLAEKEDFKQFSEFIKEPASYARKWLSDFALGEIFDKPDSNGINTFCFLAKRRIDKIIHEIKNSVQETITTPEEAISTVNEHGIKASAWVQHFISKIEIIPILKDIYVHINDRTILDLVTFRQMILQEIVTMRDAVYGHFSATTTSNVEWKEDPILALMDKIWGCEEKCMFCKEPCMNTDKQHVKFGFCHHCIQHRPTGIGGFRKTTDSTLVVDFCNALIQDDARSYIFPDMDEYRPYKEYKQQFPDWDIQPTFDTSKYWMWVMCKFKIDLKNFYHAKLPKIPSSWLDITKEEAINSL